jgi:hypothetical protein
VTTISWRLVHIIANNEIYREYAFGPGRRTFPDLEVPHTARQALEVAKVVCVLVLGCWTTRLPRGG